MVTLIRNHYTTLARTGLLLAMISIVVLSLLPLDKVPLTDVNDKLQHLAAFLLLGFLIDASLPSQSFNLSKVSGLMAYGLLIELLQLQTEYRFFSWADLIADLAGIILYFFTIPVWKRVPLINWRWS
ncbi:MULTISPECIES: VanZ family protein [unclassified Endozoicomonas]|uniref:VanZ family protein n=1 Tax=unclassified Endozoicomonas TaxID=2644528 RepID=UPI002147902A|nr:MULTISPECIES: VanZ family protein [unclassified Endozoicomonas]